MVKMTSKEITLIVPGLRRFEDAGFRELSASAGRLPALELIFARARKTSTSNCNLDETLGSLFGLSLAADTSLPAAALAHSFKYETPADHWYIHCDPVVIQPNRDHLMLLGNDMLDYSEQDAEQLISDINATYSDQPWQVKMLSPRQWVMEMPHTPAIHTCSMHSTVGRRINDFLPQGQDARAWHALMNELQMLLHSHPVNQSRNMSGRVAANSVWFWGEGVLPVPANDSASARWAQCWSNHNSTLALARLNKIPRVDLPASADIWLEQAITPGQHLIVIDSLDLPAVSLDPVTWWQVLMQLNEQWFAPLLSALRSNGALAKLTLMSADGWCYELTPTLAKRWWKRVKALV
ncbi:MAG: hypothetical protein AMJ55_04575 [Gammaproteobacteria bacterium SG8_15]|nr:MAG: hypothetical protein AMJ55_04575 [Gammaproteobacteria bacterium SG8_15]